MADDADQRILRWAPSGSGLVLQRGAHLPAPVSLCVRGQLLGLAEKASSAAVLGSFALVVGHRLKATVAVASRSHAKHPATVYTILYTCCMARTVPVRELRSNLSSLLDDVSDRRDHVLVTRNGTPAAALVPIDEYEALEETAEILSDPGALAALEAGLAEIERGETITLAELRAELAERRPAAG